MVTPGRTGLAMLAMTLAVSACAPAMGAGPGHTVLVELFTSQGCSSCPPADAFVGELPSLGWGRARVVPLTFHVDYWDALGWKDPFATPAFTERQRRYVAGGGLRAPGGEDGIRGAYTPQMIVDGAVHFSGGRRDVALAELRRAAAAPAAFDLTARAALERDRAVVTVEIVARQKPVTGGPWRVVVALAAKKARTRVPRGENAGETLEESAVVRALSEPAPVASDQRTSIRVTVERPPELPWSDIELAAFVQSETTLHVGAAVELRP